MRKVIAAALFLLLLATPLAALAWGSFAAFQERSHGFEFTGVELNSPNSGPQRCVVKVTLTLSAPTADPHRFTARVGTADGKSLTTTFTSSRESKRAAHRFSVDGLAIEALHVDPVVDHLDPVGRDAFVVD